MSRNEIGLIFQRADSSNRGKVDKSEWENLYNNFINLFEKSDLDKDGLLSEKELINGINDLTVIIFYDYIKLKIKIIIGITICFGLKQR